VPVADPTAPHGGPVVYTSALTTRFRSLTTRDGVLIRGEAGWGEFSPFADYDDDASVSWLRAAREAADVGFPAPLRDRVPVNVTIPAVGPDRAAEMVRASGGCTTAKVKVAEPGQSVDEEIARVAAVRDALGPDGHVRIDANGAWDLGTARDRLAVLDRAADGLQYAEQPVPTVEDLAALRRSVDVPIAADESVRRAEDPLRVARMAAADLLVLKVQPLGGVRACLELAESAGLPVVVSSALESSVGIAAGVALAAALPEGTFRGAPLAAGLATSHLLRTDVTSAPLLPVDGHLEVRPITPDAVTPAPDDVAAAWLARLDRVAALAGGAAGDRPIATGAQ
jgi:O-succinylbenzoate synthase